LLETKTAHAGINNLMIVTLMRKGRYEVSVFTNVGKSTTSTQDAAQAAQTALIVQGTALKASIPRLDARSSA